MQLAGKVALITGAGSGIGKAAAILLAKEGAKVAALGRTEGDINKTVAQIEANGGEAMPIVADISQSKGVSIRVSLRNPDSIPHLLP
jgi:NAD(P)-dependent dehydrogenase (short-subunit alcohol dehydrogenase family)